MAPLFDLHVAPLRSHLKPRFETREHVLITIAAAENPNLVRPRLTTVLVIDVSSSMQGLPIAQVIRSAERMTEILERDDALGVVAFDTAVRTISPIRQLDDDARKQLRRDIGALATRGTTNLSGGIAHAVLLFPDRSADERQLALVMSDGHPNVGSSTPAALAAEAALVKARGIAISTLGFGGNHDEDVLLAISDASGGRYAFVSDPRLADSSFARALGAQRDIVAEDVSVVLSPATGVSIAGVVGDPKTSFGPDGLRVHLPDLIAGDELTFVVELDVRTPRERGTWRALGVSLRAKDLGADDTVELTGCIAVTLTDAGPYPIDATVAAHVAIAHARAKRDEARAIADRGNFAGAIVVIRAAMAQLESAPGFDDESASTHAMLRDAYEILADDVTAYESRPDPEAYRTYRKSSFDYADFEAAGTRSKASLIKSSFAAQQMMDKLNSGPLPAAHLVVSIDGQPEQHLPINDHETIVGRSKSASLPLTSPMLSMRHCVIRFLDGAFWVFDLGSTSGTWVNGQHLHAGHRLSDGDEIRFGDLVAVFRLGAAPVT